MKKAGEDSESEEEQAPPDEGKDDKKEEEKQNKKPKAEKWKGELLTILEDQRKHQEIQFKIV